MRSSELLSTAIFAASIYTAFAADAASVVTDNPPGAWALSNMPGTDSNGIFAEIVASTSSDGKGVEMTININGGVTRQGGPFMYHIHDKAISTPGDCASAGGHLDPTKVGDDFKCDPNKPENCQVGDLSGKHEACRSMPGCSKSFRDAFVSLTPGNPAYIGDKSIVIHYANKTRIACSNFSMSNKSSSNNSNSTSTGTSPSASSSPSSGGGPIGGSGSPDNAPPPASPSGSSGTRSSPTPTPASAASTVQAATGLGGLFLALLGFVMW